MTLSESLEQPKIIAVIVAVTIVIGLILFLVLSNRGSESDSGETDNISQSLASLNSKIDSVSSSLTTDMNKQKSDLEAKINEFDSEYLWGVDPGGGFWRCEKPCDAGAWERMQVPFSVRNISQGKKYLWGSADDGAGTTYRCEKPCNESTGWEKIPGGLHVISATGAD